MPSVRVIIVNYNGGKFLPQCLSNLARQSFRDFEVVVVDNASTDGSADLALPDTRFRWMKSPKNLGFAVGNNVGAKGFSGDFIAFLNPDAYAAPDWLQALVNAAAQFPDFGAFGSTQYADESKTIYDGTGDCLGVFGVAWRGCYHHTVIGQPPSGEVFSPCAAASFWRAKAFFALGGYEERFFCYAEDLDLAFRYRLKGGKCLQVGNARVVHVGSGISGQNSAFSLYHGQRNMLWLLVRNMPTLLLPIALFGYFLAAIGLMVKYHAQGHAKAILKGVLDGLSGLMPFVAERQKVQSSFPPLKLARMLVWNPILFLMRGPDLRNVR
jgi:N-acetylglucosaminyl-diphospho-decaprenol L-rhamnosyltransferase